MSATVARIVLDERLLDAFLTRIRLSPRFTGSVEQRYSDPALGIVAAVLHLDVVSTRVALREADSGRVRVEVEMRGAVRWDVGLTEFDQDLDVRFSVLARPWVDLRDGDRVDLGVDLGDARVRDVDITVHQLAAIPMGRASDLIGPVGRRVLDRLSGEAIQVLLRRLGRREMALHTPVAGWLLHLSAATGQVRLRVGDRCLVLSFPAEPTSEDTCWDEPAFVDPAGAMVLVDVDPLRAGPLVQHWMAEIASEQERYRVERFGVLGDGTARLEVALERTLPRSLPAVTASMTLEVVPVVNEAELHFDLLSLTLEGGRRSGAARDGAAWLLRRRLESRLRTQARWELTLPFAPDQSWLVGIRSVQLDPGCARILLDAWFSPA